MNQTVEAARPMMPDEPIRFVGREDFERLLTWATELGVSDLSLQTGKQVRIEMHGHLRIATQRRMSASEVLDIVNTVYGENASSRLGGGKPINMALEVIPPGRPKERYRYRLNATSCRADGGRGVSITVRTLPELPPRLEDLGVEPAIVDTAAPRDGIVMVSGATGSGKSTLLAAIIRRLVEDPEKPRKICTYEEPVEFAYRDLDDKTGSLISQQDVPNDIPNFAEGLRDAMRRKPNVILVGESRDHETMSAAIDASLTGHAVYTTTHASSVAMTIRRMVGVFSPEERTDRAVSLMQMLRLIVNQTLLPTLDGRRAAAREYLVIDDALRWRIIDEPVESWAALLHQEVVARGQSMADAVDRLHRDGRVGADTAQAFRHVAAAKREAAPGGAD